MHFGSFGEKYTTYFVIIITTTPSKLFICFVYIDNCEHPHDFVIVVYISLFPHSEYLHNQFVIKCQVIWWKIIDW